MSIGTPCPPNVPGWFRWIVVDEEGTGVDGDGQATKGCVTVGPGRARRSLGKISRVQGSDDSQVKGLVYQR